MTWQTEWNAIAGRIDGLVQAAELYIRAFSARSEDPYGVAKKQIGPQTQAIFESIQEFRGDYGEQLPTNAVNCIDVFASQFGSLLSDPKTKGFHAVVAPVTAVASLKSELEYYLSDFSVIARRLSERAFVHLQRTIVADDTVGERWHAAFQQGEVACEKLGAVHLLAHGIWAFKVSAEGERTDLVFGEPLPADDDLQRAAEAIVLTEWKLVREDSELDDRIAEAASQAQLYRAGVLGGLELANYRYLVFVSQDSLEMPDDQEHHGVIFRHINVAVRPSTPSRAARRRRRPEPAKDGN